MAVSRPVDRTHDPALRSWLDEANDPASDFPIQNLPFGLFRERGTSRPPRVCAAIGAHVLDVGALAPAGLAHGRAAEAAQACDADSLNTLMGLGPTHARALRHTLSDLLQAGRDPAVALPLMVPMHDVEMLVPASVGDYTDFYASIYHATNVGSMFRPDQPLLPNYKYVPIGYHGRASSIVVSDTPVTRPWGQTRDDAAQPPRFGPSRRLDYELELAAYVGAGNPLGTPIPARDAEAHLFGLGLLNDWSARDIQTWEYQPLGPFLAKNFATTVSPWVVTVDALAPFRAPAFPRAEGDPAPLPYLEVDAAAGGFDVTLEVRLQSAAMREAGIEPFLVSRSRFTDMYWTVGQLLAHHASNGCNLRPGDILASGTVSGPTKESRGCLLERTWKGSEPIELPGGERRAFLEDGDEVSIRGYCERAGRVRIGFGECRGRIAPAAAAMP